MNTRIPAQLARCLKRPMKCLHPISPQKHLINSSLCVSKSTRAQGSPAVLRSSFHTAFSARAQGPTADALMENLNDLYATAKDEFEIAAEETEKKTVYAQDDRTAAREALTILKEAFSKAVKESDPEVAKEVTTRTGPRIRELENAVTAMEEMATMGD